VMIADIESQASLRARNIGTIVAASVEIELFFRLSKYTHGDEQTDEQTDYRIREFHKHVEADECRID